MLKRKSLDLVKARKGLLRVHRHNRKSKLKVFKKVVKAVLTSMILLVTTALIQAALS